MIYSQIPKCRYLCVSAIWLPDQGKEIILKENKSYANNDNEVL